MGLVLGCGGPSSSSPSAPPEAPTSAPAADAAHGPLGAPAPAHADQLAEVEACAACHPAAAREWRDSPHASSGGSSPWFAAARAEEAEPALCDGCHQLGIAAGAEVGCRACHGEVAATGPSGWTLALPQLAPSEHLPAGPADHERHAAAMAVASPDAVCSTCHGPDHPGRPADADVLTLTEAIATALEPAVAPGSCIGCHMPPVDRTSLPSASAPAARYPDRVGDDGAAPPSTLGRSHRMPGTHLRTAPSRTQQARVERLGAGGVDLRISGIRAVGPTSEIDVVLHHEGSPHPWPGASPAQLYLWLEGADGTARTQPTVLRLGGTSPLLPSLRPGRPQLVRFTVATSTLQAAHTVRVEVRATSDGSGVECTADAVAAPGSAPLCDPPVSRASRPGPELPSTPGPRLVGGGPAVEVRALLAADTAPTTGPTALRPAWQARAVRAAARHGERDLPGQSDVVAGLPEDRPPPSLDPAGSAGHRLVLRAYAAARSGQRTATTDRLRAAAVRTPTRVAVLRAWALAAWWAGDRATASRVAHAALALQPTDPTLRAVLDGAPRLGVEATCLDAPARCPPVPTVAVEVAAPETPPGR